jgi:hypothetical protein
MSPEQQEVNVDAEGDLSPHPLTQRSSAFSFSPNDRKRGGTRAFKFGGSSLLGAERMLRAARIVREAAIHHSVTVIVSAMKGVTDRLLRVAHLVKAEEWQTAAREADHIVQLHLDTLADLQLAEEDADRIEYELTLLSHTTRRISIGLL